MDQPNRPTNQPRDRQTHSHMDIQECIEKWIKFRARIYNTWICKNKKNNSRNRSRQKIGKGSGSGVISLQPKGKQKEVSYIEAEEEGEKAMFELLEEEV